MSAILDGVAQGYGSTHVINGLSLACNPVSLHCWVRTGPGKPRFFGTLATIMPPRNGRMSIDGVEVRGQRSARLVRDRIGYLPQDFGFDPRMTVADFVTYAAWLRVQHHAAGFGAVAEALEMVNLVGEPATIQDAQPLGRYAPAGPLLAGRSRGALHWCGSPSLLLASTRASGCSSARSSQDWKTLSWYSAPT